MAATQEALYGRLDLALSWSEAELPERERTKHVHRLHPYLGKFVPQLVEELLGRYVRHRGRVLDPFAGSGTTLVQSLESGHDALRRDLEAARAGAEALAWDGEPPARASEYVLAWYAPRAAAELLAFRASLEGSSSADVLRVVLA